MGIIVPSVLLDPGYEGTTMCQNVRNLSPNDTASQPRWFQSSEIIYYDTKLSSHETTSWLTNTQHFHCLLNVPQQGARPTTANHLRSMVVQVTLRDTTLRDTSSWSWKLSQWCWSSVMWCCIITEWPDLLGQYSLIQWCTITSQMTWILSLPDISTATNTSTWIFKIFTLLTTQHPATSYQLAYTEVLHITQCLVFILLTHFANWILFERC